MSVLQKQIQMNVITLMMIVVVTGVVSVHISKTGFGDPANLPEIVAVIGLALAGMGIHMFLGLFQTLYGKKEEDAELDVLP